MNIKKLNPPGNFKKERGKRNLGEKYDSKFYPNNYKKDVLYMNYEDLLDNLYMENKGIDYQLRSSKKYNINQKKNQNNNFNYDNYSVGKNENYSNYNFNNNNIYNINNINKNNDKNEDKENEIIINNNTNNEITFKQNQNNINIDDKENNNKNILRGRPNKLKENNTIIKNNISKYENNNNDLINNYKYNENNILNKDNDNNNNPEEEIENLNNNEYIGEDKNQENNDYEKEIINNDNNTNNVNKSEDIRLNFVMQKLGLESLIPIFENYHMSFNDILFLTRDDLNELGFKIFQKNRLISFIEEYTSKAKNYTLEEIQAFFEENSIYNLSGNQE